jgi:hypothetical protein
MIENHKMQSGELRNIAQSTMTDLKTNIVLLLVKNIFLGY